VEPKTFEVGIVHMVVGFAAFAGAVAVGVYWGHRWYFGPTGDTFLQDVTGQGTPATPAAG
jgi:hypothetical protein